MDRGSRRRLVADVARLTHEWPICADVVFDGFPREGLRHGEVLAAVRVWFAAHQTADDWILARAPEHPPGELLVVTSDRSLVRRLLPCGARIISSETLRRGLDTACAAVHAGGSPLRSLAHGPDALLAMDRHAAACESGMDQPP